jgi:hypothetical protein
MVPLPHHGDIPGVGPQKFRGIVKQPVHIFSAPVVFFQIRIRPPWIMPPLHYIKEIPKVNNRCAFNHGLIQMRFQHSALTMRGIEMAIRDGQDFQFKIGPPLTNSLNLENIARLGKGKQAVTSYGLCMDTSHGDN